MGKPHGRAFFQIGDELFAVVSNGRLIAAPLDTLHWQPVLPAMENVSKVLERGDCCVRFEGAGGQVYVHVIDEDDKKTAVAVDSREWDYQAREFLDLL